MRGRRNAEPAQSDFLRRPRNTVRHCSVALGLSAERPFPKERRGGGDLFQVEELRALKGGVNGVMEGLHVRKRLFVRRLRTERGQWVSEFRRPGFELPAVGVGQGDSGRRGPCRATNLKRAGKQTSASGRGRAAKIALYLEGPMRFLAACNGSVTLRSGLVS